MVPSGGNRTGASVERAARAVYSSAPNVHTGHAVDVIGIALLELLGIGLAVMLLAGCGGITEMIQAAGNDSASNCLSIATPYGSLTSARVNADGVEVTVSPGQCRASRSGPK